MPNSPVMPSVEEYQALLAERDVRIPANVITHFGGS
jgi:hypothetical protein